MGCDVKADDRSQKGQLMSPDSGWGPGKHLVVRCLKRNGVTDDTRLSHLLEDSIIESRKVVVRDHDHGSLVETPLHSVVELLSEYTVAIEYVGAAIWRVW
jgi:hypothetical protein